MGDRTNIADALERMAVEAEDGYSIPAGPSEVTTFRDAARLLRADPDTSDELAAEARRLKGDPTSKTSDEINAQRDAGWPDFHPEDYCHRCGRPNGNRFIDLG